MQKINQIINFLKSHSLNAITIQSEFGDVIFRNYNLPKIIENHNSVENFFNEIFENHNTITVVFRRKRGTSYAIISDNMVISKVSSTEDKILQNNFMPPKPPVQNYESPRPHVSHDQFGLNGLLGGLNMADVVYRHQDYPKTLSQKEALEKENQVLKDKNLELERQLMKLEIQKENTSNTKELINGLSPLLGPLLSKLASPSTGALASPQMPQGTDIQNKLISMIMAYDSQTNNYIDLIVSNFENQAFVSELFELLEKHQIISKNE